MPDPAFHWSLTGVKGHAARQLWQPMQSVGSIIRTLPNAGFGLFALTGSTGHASTQGAFSHWRHVAMNTSSGQFAHGSCWIWIRARL